MTPRYVHINDEGRKLECQNPETCRFGTAARTEGEARTLYEKKMSAHLLASTTTLKEHRRQNSAGLRYVSLKDMSAAELANCLRYLSRDLGFDEEKVEQAIEVATVLHQNQVRTPHNSQKRTPYIEHPLRNAIRLIRMGVKEQDLVVSAVLHDTIEDGSVDFVLKCSKGAARREDVDEPRARKLLGAYIRKEFGEHVLNVVLSVTNDYVPKGKKQVGIEEKTRTYCNHVARSIHKNPDALLVKLSDYVDNATGLYHNLGRGREERIMRMAIKYLPVADVFRHEMHVCGRLPIPDSERREILHKMRNTERRLRSIIVMYESMGFRP